MLDNKKVNEIQDCLNGNNFAIDFVTGSEMYKEMNENGGEFQNGNKKRNIKKKTNLKFGNQ